ncbi:MAG: NADH-quinone oxidoreductase subunit C [Ignavibacteriales bacterium]
MIENIVEIKREYLLAEVKKLKNSGYRFVTASCIDLGSEFMIYYHFDKDGQMEHLKLVSDKEQEIPSISGIYFAGALTENEMKDLFGIKIKDLVLDYGGKFMITHDVGPAPFAKENKI